MAIIFLQHTIFMQHYVLLQMNLCLVCVMKLLFFLLFSFIKLVKVFRFSWNSVWMGFDTTYDVLLSSH